MTTNIEKPLTVKLADAQEELIKCINEISQKENLSFFFLELIISGIYKEIVQQKDAEMLRERTEYNEEIQKKERKSDK